MDGLEFKKRISIRTHGSERRCEGEEVFREMASPVRSTGCSLPLVGERDERSLGREDPLEEKGATHSSMLVWKIP